MTHINLLPWRQLKRDRIKKMRLYFGLTLLITGGVILALFHYGTKQLTYQQVARASVHQTLDRDVYQKKRQQFEDQFKAINVKQGEQSLDSLRFIGLLKNDLKTWALISQSDGLVSVVETGDYLGRERGHILRIKETAIEIEKSLWSRHGLVKKSVLLLLHEKKRTDC